MKRLIHHMDSVSNTERFRNNRIPYLLTYVAALFTLGVILQGYFVGVTCLLPLAFIVLIWTAESRRLLVALLPFLILLISYESLRGYAYDLGMDSIHTQAR